MNIIGHEDSWVEHDKNNPLNLIILEALGTDTYFINTKAYKWVKKNLPSTVLEYTDASLHVAESILTFSSENDLTLFKLKWCE